MKFDQVQKIDTQLKGYAGTGWIPSEFNADKLPVKKVALFVNDYVLEQNREGSKLPPHICVFRAYVDGVELHFISRSFSQGIEALNAFLLN